MNREAIALIKAVVLSLSCGLLLAAVYASNSERIAVNEQRHQEALLRAILARLGPVAESAVLKPIKGEMTAYRVLPAASAESDEVANSVADIRQVQAPDGYNGTIDLWLARDSENHVLAVRVIKHNETPGLGDAIEAVDWLSQFDGQTLDEASANRWRLAQAGGDFDGITGATISARAVVRAIGKAGASSNDPLKEPTP